MKELTNEFYRSMYGAYPSCKVSIDNWNGDNSQSEPYPNVAMNNNSICVGKNKVGVDMWFKIKYTKPILTPLSAITEEDAVEVAKIMNWDYSNEPDSEAHYDLEGLRDDISSAGDNVFDGGFSQNQLIIDHLRSKSYDCGYMHIQSLIDAGIAIDATNI